MCSYFVCVCVLFASLCMLRTCENTCGPIAISGRKKKIIPKKVLVVRHTHTHRKHAHSHNTNTHTQHEQTHRLPFSEKNFRKFSKRRMTSPQKEGRMTHFFCISSAIKAKCTEIQANVVLKCINFIYKFLHHPNVNTQTHTHTGTHVHAHTSQQQKNRSLD